MKKKRSKFLLIFLIIFLIIFSLLLIRAFNPREIDDLHSSMHCEEDLILESDILWVIPKLNNNSISEDKEWCAYILSLNKTLGMHGVTHEFEEFLIERDQEYIQEGIDIFEGCFKFKPQFFKPPQLKISKQNKQLIKNNSLILKNILNQVFKRVYHCGDFGRFSNNFIGRF